MAPGADWYDTHFSEGVVAAVFAVEAVVMHSLHSRVDTVATRPVLPVNLSFNPRFGCNFFSFIFLLLPCHARLSFVL